MRFAAIVIQKVRILFFFYEFSLVSVVSCPDDDLYTYILCKMFYSTRDEELLKRFSKDFLRRRELKKNADVKRREGGKRREEGIFVRPHGCSFG